MNLILATDSYKLTHWKQYPEGTEHVYSYFESRVGARYPYTVFFGLQHLLRGLTGEVVTDEHLQEAQQLASKHFGSDDMINTEGWEHIINWHDGKLPLLIRAVPEGMAIPTGNVLMTVENTDPECYWLTNAIESYLTHLWYPCTVATLSREVKIMLKKALEDTGSSLNGLPFMLHDFGYRGATTHDAAAIGGAAHLVNFLGTDTLPAIQLLRDSYHEELGSSVPATEHSVMTALGPEGEDDMISHILEQYPSGPLSIVVDSYNVYDCVYNICARKKEIMQREGGPVVIRPDSVTDAHKTPGELVTWILQTLGDAFGGTSNGKRTVLDPHVRVLWGDGLTPADIQQILDVTAEAGWAAENLVFGMGGGLLQKLNRDTQRFAFKCSAQKREGEWHPVYKEPLGSDKTSKAGRLKLTIRRGVLATLAEGADGINYLLKLFEDGKLERQHHILDIRQRAELL